MSKPTPIQTLIDILNQLGVSAGTNQDCHKFRGFPYILPLNTGDSVILDLPEPACLRRFSPSEVGFAIIDPSGYTISKWGAADRFEQFETLACLHDGEFADLFSEALQYGQSTRLFGHWRCFAVKLGEEGNAAVHILIANAGEEAAATRRANLSSRHVDALKRIGKALTMNQTLQPLSVSSVHMIGAALDLAAVLLWVRKVEDGPFELLASVGTNDAGIAVLSQLHMDDDITCIAELAAQKGEPLLLKRISESPMTTDLEAKFCYLQPGSLFAVPLMNGPKILGVVEFISKQGDSDFLESEDLLITIAEHLSLAINSAIMFEGVERQASYDPLTGVANHRTMQEFLARKLNECERAGLPMGVVMLDVDHFRSFNEEEGHDAGDQVLRMVADVLVSSLRNNDMAARYGGEEFTLILPGVGASQVMLTADRVRQQITSLVHITASGHHRHVTASLGIAMYPETATDSASLLKAADSALFTAKRLGRNRTVMFTPEDEVNDRLRVTTISTVEPWILEGQVGPSQKLLAEAEGAIEHLAVSLKLNENQQSILLAALMLAPSWLAAQQSADEEYIAELKSSADLRAVIPCLTTLAERFDEHGKLLPILGRSLAVLMAYYSPEANLDPADVGKFDPEIQAMVAGFGKAA